MIRITISEDHADRLLDQLPGGRELYEHLADVFLAAYYGDEEWFKKLTGRELDERLKR